MIRTLLPRTKEELGLTVSLLVGVFFTPLSRYSFSLFGIFLTPLDLVFSLFFICLMLNTFFVQKRIFKRFITVPLILNSLIVIATIIGIFSGNNIQSVLREFKLVIFFAFIAVYARAISNKKVDIFRIFFILICFTTLGSLYDLYARIFNIYTISAFAGNTPGAVTYAYTPFGLIIRDYGWVSTFHYQVFVSIILFSLIIFQSHAKPLYLAIFAINVIANLFTITRGFVLGLTIGLFLTIVLWSLSISEEGKIGISKKFKPLITTVALITICFVLSSYYYPPIKAPIIRLFSVLQPDVANNSDISNMEYRIQSIQLGWYSALNAPLGVGFGILSSLQKANINEARRVSLLYHNSLGYIFYSFGLVGGFTILLMFFILGFRSALNSLRATGKVKLILVISTSAFISLLSMAFTSGNYLFSVDSVLPFVILQLALLVSRMPKGLRS